MLRPGSNGSNRSSRAGGAYRTVARDSYVEENLFGDTVKAGAGIKKTGRTTTSQVAVINKPDRLTAGAVTTVGRTKVSHPPEVVTLTRKELDRMLGPSPIMTASEIQRLRKEAEERRQAESAVAMARKTRMLAMEEERKKSVPPTETERLKAAADGATRSRADLLREEELDEVKAMNQMVMYAKCATIRDAQLEEKKHMMLEDESEQRQLDLMMEVDRIKALDNYEERERQRFEERRKGSLVLNAQIEDRKREAVRQEELRDQERIQLHKELERLKATELVAQAEKAKRSEALVFEVAAANEEQINRKKEVQAREAEEDARIAEYVRLKQLREAALAEEKERIAKEKELETARLRAQQERAADKQAEIDELRARRYQESAERSWRAREAAAAAKQVAALQELSVSRQAQKHAKVKMMAEMAEVEAAEFKQVLAANKQKEAEDFEAELAKAELSRRHMEELQQQIASNTERTTLERKQYLEDGAKLREATSMGKHYLEEIKMRKLKELELAGVPARYRAELERKKIGDW